MRQSTGQASQTTMSACFLSSVSVIARSLERRPHPVRRRRNTAEANARRMMDRVEDRWRRRDQRRLADPLGAIGAERLGVLDEQALDRRNVADRRDEIVVQVLSTPRQEFFHQRKADALREAAMDLALDLDRVDGAADIMRGDDAPDLDGAEPDVDLDLRHLCGEGIARIGRALAIVIE